MLALVAGAGAAASDPEEVRAQASSGKPNIVFIMADDLRASDMPHMPKTRALLKERGTEFTRAWVTRSLCCPSRATVLRGQYAHNHRVWVNVPPSGGFWKFKDEGHESATVATRLDYPGNFADGVDYETVLIGKYLNRYGQDRSGNYAPTTHVPPGWDEWYAWQGDYHSDERYSMNENGRVVSYERAKTHDTDLYARMAEDFVRRESGDTPFYMHLTPNAPHNPAYAAERHRGMFRDTPLPKPVTFNEADVSDKPAWLRAKPRLSSARVAEMTALYRQRLRALQSVDDMVEGLVDVLRETGELGNTNIVFTSDNGVYLGEHRLDAKAAPYNAAPRVPLLVRGPGVPEGATRSQLVLNNDFAPTFADMADAKPHSFVDGRSLLPLLRPNPTVPWRTGFLVEHRRTPEEYAYVRAVPNYDSLRTSRHSYTVYETGERELYDLSRDPYELENVYEDASPSLVSSLNARLSSLKRCAGAGTTEAGSCRRAEGG